MTDPKEALINVHAWAEAVRHEFDGKPMWIWLDDHPEATEIFNALLTAYLDALASLSASVGVTDTELDPRALDAAIVAWKSPRSHDSVEGNTEAAIRAYLALSLPSSGGEVVAE